MKPRKPTKGITRTIVNDLGKAIVTGTYAACEFPTESALCEHYAASRTVTREAVKMLTAKGLLSARPRKGTIIEPEDHWNLLDPDVLQWLLEREFSLDLLIEFIQMRCAIEPEAAALAARHATDHDKAAIAHAIERMMAAEKGKDDTLMADIAFHVAVLNATGNRFYKQLRDMIETALRISIVKTNAMNGVKIADTHSHRITAEAIINGDAEAARKYMAAMMRQALDLMLRARNSEG